jgi:hypothetical protein
MRMSSGLEYVRKGLNVVVVLNKLLPQNITFHPPNTHPHSNDFIRMAAG